MTNEEIVEKIQCGENIRENLYGLYEKNRGMIARWCKRYGSDAELDDLLQESYFAVVITAQRYDPTKGASFVTYLHHWVRQTILVYLRDNGLAVRLPAHMAERIRTYNTYCTEYQTEHGTTPTDGETSAALQVTIEQLMEIKKAQRMLKTASLNAPIDEETELADMIPDAADAIGEATERIQREQLSKTLWSCVDGLPGRQPAIIRGCFQEGRTLTEMASDHGVSAQSIQQDKEKAIRTLRRPGVTKKLQHFLDDEYYSLGLQMTSNASFKSSHTSSTERAALKIIDARIRYLQNENNR